MNKITIPDWWFEEWWQPADLVRAARAIMCGMPIDEFFRRSDMKTIREALVAAEFAALRPWGRDWTVRPIHERERFPDFQMLSDLHMLSFEIVEADRRGRRRGDEYAEAAQRAAAGTPSEMEYYDPDEETRAALDVVAERIAQKAAKHYGEFVNLLVYVNMSEGEPTQLYAAQLQQRFGDSFDSAWLLWQTRAFRLWPKAAKIKDIWSRLQNEEYPHL